MTGLLLIGGSLILGPLIFTALGRRLGIKEVKFLKLEPIVFLDKSLLSQALLGECRIKYNQVATNTEMITTLHCKALVVGDINQNLPKIVTKVCFNVCAQRL